MTRKLPAFAANPTATPAIANANAIHTYLRAPDVVKSLSGLWATESNSAAGQWLLLHRFASATCSRIETKFTSFCRYPEKIS